MVEAYNNERKIVFCGIFKGIFNPSPCLQRMNRAGDSVAVCKLPGA